MPCPSSTGRILRCNSRLERQRLSARPGDRPGENVNYWNRGMHCSVLTKAIDSDLLEGLHILGVLLHQGMEYILLNFSII